MILSNKSDGYANCLLLFKNGLLDTKEFKLTQNEKDIFVHLINPLIEFNKTEYFKKRDLLKNQPKNKPSNLSKEELSNKVAFLEKQNKNKKIISDTEFFIGNEEALNDLAELDLTIKIKKATLSTNAKKNFADELTKAKVDLKSRFGPFKEERSNAL